MDNQFFCFPTSLHEIHNGQIMCRQVTIRVYFVPTFVL